MTPRESIQNLKERIGRSIIGQDHIVERLLIALLANGNVLVEGLPGLAKTRAVKSLANNLDVGLSRIQFTPDLLPSDITGSEVYYSTDKGGQFQFQPGPIFNNIVLADEVNRAPAKVQAALLEAMEERQVTVGGTTHKLPELFMVMATQNPIEQEGTYPLPEAQMDRFIMHVMITYPAPESEVEIVQLVRGEEGRGGPAVGEDAIAQATVFEARSEIEAIHVAPAIDRYIVDLVSASRQPDGYGEDLKRWIQVGASPRGSISLDKCSRVYAWLQGSDHVTPDHVRAVAHDVLRHRISLSYDAHAEGTTATQTITELLRQVAVA